MSEEMVARLIDDYRPEAYATAMAARDAYASIDATMIEFCDEVIERHGLEEADRWKSLRLSLMNIVTLI